VVFKESSGQEKVICKGICAIPNQNRILLGGEEVVVQPKVMQLLVILSANQGQTVTKQDLIEAIWPDIVVGQESLANIVARLRRALNDSAKQPAYVETVQGIGYRWLPELEQEQIKSNHPKRKIAAAIAVGLFVTGLGGYYVWPQQAVSTISDLHIESTELGVEIAVGVETDNPALNQEAMLAEVEKLTGLDAKKGNYKIKIDEPPVPD